MGFRHIFWKDHQASSGEDGLEKVEKLVKEQLCR